jgi:hypothetical protein
MTTTVSKPKLPAFEGREVVAARVKITNAGDGLSDALAVSPVALHMDDEVFYVLRGTCAKVGHEADKHENLIRVHTIKADQITEVDGDTARKMLQAAAEELERRKAELDGQMMLDAEQAAEERERADLAATGSARDTQRP